MSIPRNHHYLPEFYLKRWAKDGQVVRYTRPLGANGALDCRMKPPSAVCFETDMYHLPDIIDPDNSQIIEKNLFQRVDDKAALALSKFDQPQALTLEEHEALCQFVISLLHRTPDRLAALSVDISKQTNGAPFAGLIGKDYDDKLKATTNRLLLMLVQSNSTLSDFSKFKAIRIVIIGASKSLLTSDRPMTASAQLNAGDAYILLPYAPDRLLILTQHESIAKAFEYEANKNSNKFVSSINKAIVEQSENIIIADNKKPTRMIDKLFLRPHGHVVCPAGLIRRSVPMSKRPFSA